MQNNGAYDTKFVCVGKHSQREGAATERGFNILVTNVSLTYCDCVLRNAWFIIQLVVGIARRWELCL